MRLSKTAKIVIGILTIFQLFGGLGFLIWLFSSFIPEAIAMEGQEPSPDFILSFVGGMIFWIIFLSIYTFGLLVFYLVHVATNKQISDGMKVLWIIIMLVFSLLGEVVYYFVEILPKQSLTAKIENS